MSFTIIVSEANTKGEGALTTEEVVERYRQTVDELDLRAVMAAVNHRPRKPRTTKKEVK